MKCLFKVCAAAAIIAAVTVAVAASRRTGAQTAGQAAGAVPAGKLGVIDTDAFTNPKTGVARLAAAANTLEREFKPRQEELRALQSRKEAMEKDNRNITEARLREFKTLEEDIKRKVEDANRDFERRSKELTEPVSNDLNQNLREYARQRDIAVIMDISKLSGAVLVVNDAINITDAFIADYNRRNPAAATPARP